MFFFFHVCCCSFFYLYINILSFTWSYINNIMIFQAVYASKQTLCFYSSEAKLIRRKQSSDKENTMFFMN